MKTIIQIFVLFVAILVGSLWEVFRPEIYNFLRLAEPIVESGKAGPQNTQVAAVPPPQKTADAQTVPPQNTEVAATAPPQKAVDAQTVPPQKTVPVKTDDKPASAGAPAKPPDPAGEDAMKNQEAQIQRIVMERYPEIPKIPFAEKYPDLSKLPRAVFPERIQTRQELNFKQLQEGKLLGVSVVKANGSVRPRRIKEDEIEVSSLADDKMIETLPLSETDFAAVVEASYDAGLERAIARAEEMREADRVEIRKNQALYLKLMTEGKVWHDPEGAQLDVIKISVEQLLAGRAFKPLAYYGNGLVQVEEGGYSGGYYVVIILLEGNDGGFGPYHWRAKCLLRDAQIVGWVGIPERSFDSN